ncbi:Ig-like domain-containing protein [Plantactinospora siamensis]|uniref:Ig-like domain-containing protein n=1 Tax=Plantactinospora siamensis TaxID=555372 RepID=A0ABV6P2A4_9ACTN
MKRRPRIGLALAALACGSMALAGCTGGGGSKAGAGRKAAAPPPVAVAIAPAANATNVPVSSEVVATATNGKITEVTLTDDKGAKVDGAMRPDGSSWLPSRPLDYKRGYTAQVTATDGAGKATTSTAKFTTMAKPDTIVQTSLNLQNGQSYGVNLPLVVAFDPPVPKEARAAVQKRLLVSTDPPQPGAWSWLDEGNQVSYRAPDPWKPGTRITARAALAGLPMGKAGFGDDDHTAVATVAPDAVRMDIDNDTKQMYVYKDNRLVKTIPVSLGKPSTPSSSGNMVIMEKFDSTVFDTRGEPNGGYVVTVQDAQRLTWGGEFIHSAPWSEGEQGYTNTSHGCVNVSSTTASWLMRTTHVGDLVRVRGTEVQLARGNGWTAWNDSWDQFVKGSALPVPQDLKPAATPPPAAVTPGNSAAPATTTPTPAPTNSGG